jgi:hypothetical protein
MQTSKVVIGFRSIPSHRHQLLSSSVVKSKSWRMLSSKSAMFGTDNDNDNDNNVDVSVDDIVDVSVGDVVDESVGDVVVESAVESVGDVVSESVGDDVAAESVDDIVVESVDDAVVESVGDDVAAESVDDDVVSESVDDAVVELVDDIVVELVGDDIAAESVDDDVVSESVIDIVDESVVESVVESVGDVFGESVGDVVGELVDESVDVVDDIPSTTTKRKRKRKKKKQVIDATTTNNVITKKDEDEEEEENEEETLPEEKSVVVVSEPTSVLDLKPREDAPVQMEMANLYPNSGGKSDSEFDLVSSATSMLSSIIKKIGKDKASKDKKSFEMKNKIPDGMTDGGISRPLNDSLDQLLEDAALMKVAEDEDDESKGGFFSDSDGTGIKSVVGNALSTIVTVDFFIVIGFLVWFIAGIFCSSILKDDTVQILFNNNFERLVQPSLGLLMVAAVGGSFFNKEEQDM